MSPAEELVLEEIRKVAPAASSTALLDDLPIDSLEFLDLLQTLEALFDIKVQDEKLQDLQSVHDLIAAFTR